MFMLSAIVAGAVFVVVASQAARAKPAGIALTGLLGLVLGCGVTALWTESLWGSPLTASVAAAETQKAASEGAAATEKDRATSPPTNAQATPAQEPSGATAPQAAKDAAEKKTPDGKETPPAPAGQQHKPAEKLPQASAEAAATKPAAEAAKDAAVKQAPDAKVATSPSPTGQQSKPAEKPPQAKGDATASKPAAEGKKSDQAKPAAGKPQADAENAPLEFVTHIRHLTPNRPAWLDSKPVVDGELQRVAVKAGPHYRMRQCQQDLDAELKLATDEFICDYLRSPRASVMVGYELDEIKRRLVQTTFEEQLETSVGVMNQVHALLEFDKSFRKELDERWHRIKAISRLAEVGVVAGIVLLLVTTLFGYFKLDTATRGYYTGRLQFAAAAAILALVAASVLLAKWIPWM